MCQKCIDREAHARFVLLTVASAILNKLRRPLFGRSAVPAEHKDLDEGIRHTARLFETMAPPAGIKSREDMERWVPAANEQIQRYLGTLTADQLRQVGRVTYNLSEYAESLNTRSADRIREMAALGDERAQAIAATMPPPMPEIEVVMMPFNQSGIGPDDDRDQRPRGATKPQVH